MIADFLILLIFAFRIRESCAAVDFSKDLTDSYGTSFVIPVPLCDQKESVHIALLPRDIGLTLVTISGKSFTRFAEINFGNTKTLTIPCTSQGQSEPLVPIPDGCIHVNSNNKVGINVLYRQDSYRVMPVDLLASFYYPTIFRGSSMLDNDTVYFLSIGVAYNNTTVHIIERNANQSTVEKLKGLDQVMYYTKEGTNLTVISSMPIILLVGSFKNDSSKSTGGLILEQDTPPMNWGKFYVLPLIQPMLSVCIGMKAMENGVTVDIAAKDGTTAKSTLSKDVLEEVCLADMYGFVTVSASRPMLPLFVMNSLDKGKIAILHTVPPLERYLPSPCKIGICYRNAAMTLVAGLKTSRLDMSPYTNRKDYSTTDIINSPLWVHIVNRTTLSAFSKVVEAVNTPLLPRPLWFFEINLLERDNQLWIVNSPSVISRNNNNFSCTSSETSAGDQLDNDCDGLIDEELDNNEDDDNDNLIDEDLERTEAANESIFRCKVYAGSVPSRKISVLHIIFREDISPEKEYLRDLAFIVSVSSALLSVIFFIGACFLVDYLEMHGIIKKHRSRFGR